MKAIRIHEHGGPQVLRFEEAPAGQPGPGEALIEVHVAGVNFIDTYYRSGLYKPPAMPFIPGSEAAGVVSAIGPDVTGVQVGDRVAYATSLGAYAEYVVVPAWKLAVLPPGIDFRSGTAAMLQGMTAHYLSHSAFPLKQG